MADRAEINSVVGAVTWGGGIDSDGEAVAAEGRARHAGGGLLRPIGALIGADEQAQRVREVGALGAVARDGHVEDLDSARRWGRSRGRQIDHDLVHRRAGDGAGEHVRDGGSSGTEYRDPVLAAVG